MVNNYSEIMTRINELYGTDDAIYPIFLRKTKDKDLDELFKKESEFIKSLDKLN